MSGVILGWFFMEVQVKTKDKAKAKIVTNKRKTNNVCVVSIFLGVCSLSSEISYR